MSNVFLKPKIAGSIVRDPMTLLPLAEQGEWKSFNQFWQRRVRDGDVVVAALPAIPSKRRPRAAPGK